MRILQLCLRIPYPAHDGGAIAMHNMSEALSSLGHEVHILAFNTRKHFVDPDKLPYEYKSKYHLKWVYLDASVKPLPAFLNLFGKRSYNVTRFDSPAMHRMLSAVLQEYDYDLVLMESLFMLPYIETIRQHCKSPVVYRAHNIEHLIWERMASSATNPILRLYLSHLAGRLKCYESDRKSQLNAIVTLTREDADWFISDGYKGPLFISAIGLDTNKYSGVPVSDGCDHLFHLGSMDWLPNVEGVDWFLKNVWPVLEEKHPNLTLHIAGKGMPAKYFELNSERLKVYGYIDDVNAFMNDKQLMVVPLFSGSGMRVKIIEGMAAARTIVATDVGAEGIDVHDGHDILIANQVDSFVRQIERCISDVGFAKNIGLHARSNAIQNYDRGILAHKLCDFLMTVKTS